jgi:hypothetical protein
LKGEPKQGGRSRAPSVTRGRPFHPLVDDRRVEARKGIGTYVNEPAAEEQRTYRA